MDIVGDVMLSVLDLGGAGAYHAFGEVSVAGHRQILLVFRRRTPIYRVPRGTLTVTIVLPKNPAQFQTLVPIDIGVQRNIRLLACNRSHTNPTPHAHRAQTRSDAWGRGRH